MKILSFVSVRWGVMKLKMPHRVSPGLVLILVGAFHVERLLAWLMASRV